MKRSAWPVLLALSTLFSSCNRNEKELQLPEGVGVNLSYIDTTLSPGEDFFKYVNGGWLKQTEIPGDQGTWGSFNELAENTRKDVLAVLQQAADSEAYPEGSDQRKAADFYAIGMDSALAEQVGLQPLAPFFEQIEAIKTKEDLQAYFVRQQLSGGDAFFTLFIDSDLKKSDEVALFLAGSGLGLPEREYYLKDDPKSKEIRQRYLEHVARMLEITGLENSQAIIYAQGILKLETSLASATMTKEDRRDPDKTYNKKSINELRTLLPSFSWKNYLEVLNVKNVDTLIVVDTDFLPAVEKIISSKDMEITKAYLRWHLINGAAPYLNYDVVKADFDFYSNYLQGVEQMRPRWKRVLSTTDHYLGEAIGQLYVDKHFPPEAKKKALEMVENIKLAFADRVQSLAWMSDSTKKKALDKLSTFTVKIGYPDEWKDYVAFVVEKNPETASFINNVMKGEQFRFKRELNKLGKPVNRKEWFMTPQTVNAYYNPSFNEIVFPAAILQPPFYDYRADEALNYGGIGAVIGHEISHGFDDQGSKFDGQGNRNDWWTAEDLEKFTQRGKALADQFSQYEPLEGVFVQGDFTLGENIGDLGGVSVAYDGLQRYLKEHGPIGRIDGFTPEQRFFLSWGTIWRVKYRDETLRTRVKNDPHSPGMYRANGPLTNMTEFYSAFDVKEGDKMYRSEAERVKIW